MARAIHSGLEVPATSESYYKKYAEERKFGITMAIMFPLIFCGLLPWIFSFTIPMWPLYLAAGFLFFGLLAPSVLLPVQKYWMKFAHVLGAINSRIILGLIYVAMFIPIGFLVKVFGKKLMPLKFDKEASSYKIILRESNLIERMEKPY